MKHISGTDKLFIYKNDKLITVVDDNEESLFSFYISFIPINNIITHVNYIDYDL